jgi:hypothetical protein
VKTGMAVAARKPPRYQLAPQRLDGLKRFQVKRRKSCKRQELVPTDKHTGQGLRMRRTIRGISRSKLKNAVDVTFKLKRAFGKTQRKQRQFTLFRA